MNDEERIDNVLKELDSNSTGRCDLRMFLKNTLKDDDLNSFQRIIPILEKNEWAERIRGSLSPTLEILPAGREIVKLGGYIKYLEKKKAEEEKEAHRSDIEDKLAEKKLKQINFLLKHKWLPFILSGLAILISAGALVVSIIALIKQ